MGHKITISSIYSGTPETQPGFQDQVPRDEDKPGGSRARHAPRRLRSSSRRIRRDFEVFRTPILSQAHTIVGGAGWLEGLDSSWATRIFLPPVRVFRCHPSTHTGRGPPRESNSSALPLTPRDASYHSAGLRSKFLAGFPSALDTRILEFGFAHFLQWHRVPHLGPRST